MRDQVHVSLVVFPECDPSIVYGVFDTLWAAGRDFSDNEDHPVFIPRIVSISKQAMQLVTGVSIIPQDGINEVNRTDVVFVPNVLVKSAACLRGLDRRLLDWIKAMHGQGAALYSACGGSLVLAEAGLLEGEAATTHWSYAPLFKEQFPDVTLHADRLIVQSGDGHSIVCSGGASSWQDLALLLVSKFAGTAEAIRLSKLFLYQWHRDGQLPYASMIQNVKHGDARIESAQQWIAENYHKADVVGDLVRECGLPKRSFDRRFRTATGYSPLAYIQALRIEEAKQLLETTSTAVEAIGREVGYEDASSFRRLFRRLAGIGPAEYRRKLQPPKMIGAIDRPGDSRRARVA